MTFCIDKLFVIILTRVEDICSLGLFNDSTSTDLSFRAKKGSSDVRVSLLNPEVADVSSPFISIPFSGRKMAANCHNENENSELQSRVFFFRQQENLSPFMT